MYPLFSGVCCQPHLDLRLTSSSTGLYPTSYESISSTGFVKNVLQPCQVGPTLYMRKLSTLCCEARGILSSYDSLTTGWGRRILPQSLEASVIATFTSGALAANFAIALLTISEIDWVKPTLRHQPRVEILAYMLKNYKQLPQSCMRRSSYTKSVNPATRESPAAVRHATTQTSKSTNPSFTTPRIDDYYCCHLCVQLTSTVVLL